MALYDRFKVGAVSRLPIHQFMGGLRELERGNETKAAFVAAFGLNPAEEADLDILIAKYTGLAADRRVPFVEALDDWLCLTEQGFLINDEATFNARVSGFS